MDFFPRGAHAEHTLLAVGLEHGVVFYSALYGTRHRVDRVQLVRQGRQVHLDPGDPGVVRPGLRLDQAEQLQRALAILALLTVGCDVGCDDAGAAAWRRWRCCRRHCAHR